MNIQSDTKLIGFWPIFGFLALAPIVAVTYALYSLGYALHRKGIPQPILWPYIAVFAIINTAHNWIVCTVLFAEFPREFFTTTRLKRQKNSEEAWRRELADMIGGFLNSQDPGHY